MNGLTSHKQIVRHDIKLSAKIVHNLDNKVGLWREEKKDESAKQEEEKENKTTQSSNEVEQAVSKIAFIYILLIEVKTWLTNVRNLYVILGFRIVI